MIKEGGGGMEVGGGGGGGGGGEGGGRREGGGGTARGRGDVFAQESSHANHATICRRRVSLCYSIVCICVGEIVMLSVVPRET